MDKIPRSTTFPPTGKPSEESDRDESIRKSETFPSLNKKLPKKFNKARRDLFERALREAFIGGTSDAFAAYDKQVLEDMKKDFSEFEEIKNKKTKQFADKKVSSSSLYYDDSEAKKTSPSVGGGKKEGLSQIVKVAEDLKSSSMETETATEAEAKPRLVKIFPTKVSSQIKEDTFNKMEASHSQSSQVKKVQRKVKEDAWTFLPVLDSLQLPWMEKTYVHEAPTPAALEFHVHFHLYRKLKALAPKPLLISLFCGCKLTKPGFEFKSIVTKANALHTFCHYSRVNRASAFEKLLTSIDECFIKKKEIKGMGRRQSVYRSWSVYVSSQQQERPQQRTAITALRLGAVAAMSKLKEFLEVGPEAAVRRAFRSGDPENRLETLVNSNRTFFRKEWTTFFSSLRKYSIYFLQRTGFLKHLLFCFPCLKKLHLKKIDTENKYCILVDFALAIYQFAYETKFTYSVSDELIKDFTQVQEEFSSIVVNQNFDPRDNDFFKHLSILSHAALQTNTGYPEQAKAKLQGMCNIFLRGAQQGEYKYTRGFIISLYFHQLALAMERGLTTRVTLKHLYEEYILMAYESFYKCYRKEEILFPFYGFVVRDYVRLLWDPNNDEAEETMQSLYKTLQAKKHCDESMTCDLLVLLGALASNTDEEQQIVFSDLSIEVEKMIGNIEELKIHFHGYVLQLVIDLIPILVHRKMNDRASNLIFRSIRLFKGDLKNTRRMAFLSNMLVHCQYDFSHVESQNFYNWLRSTWKGVYRETELNQLPIESKHYLYFWGIFQADVHNRFGEEISRNEVFEVLKSIEFKNDKLYDSFLKPMTNFQIESYSKKRSVHLNLDPNLKMMVYWGVGGDRLFQEKEFLSNAATRKWKDLLFKLLFIEK